ncbi:hypothetical protein [Noviherbaspirillum sp.]|uniref:hypothetical protein n=1 Tax=Noviherbaspirillum sp. TaxID=1926288 RepID=UPI0025E28259|nr:hypothetical protein [Noviherbaspirillum sp.]
MRFDVECAPRTGILATVSVRKAAEKIIMFRAMRSLCCYNANAAQPPLQEENTPSVPSPVPSIHHAAVGSAPITPPYSVKEVPASSTNEIGFTVYSFGGDLPPELHIEHRKMSNSEVIRYIADTSKEGDEEVGINALKYGSQSLCSHSFGSCVPVFAYYPSDAGENADNGRPKALYHAASYVPDILNGLLASPEYGKPTDIFVVTRNWDAGNRRHVGINKQSAVSLYINAHLPVGSRFHIIEVPWGGAAVRVAADKIEIWETS